MQIIPELRKIVTYDEDTHREGKKEAKPIKQRHILNKQTPKIKKQDFGTKIADLQV